VQADFPQFLLRECAYAPDVRLPRHAHQYSNVTVVVGGHIDETSGDTEIRGQAFSVVFKPAGSEHANRVSGAGARTVSLALRRGSELAATAAARPWSWFEQPEIVRAAVSLVRALRAAPSAADLEAHGFELLAEVFAARCGSGSSARPSWLDEVTRILETRFDEPLRFDAIARAVGVHPVYLSRAFQRYAGRSMQQYVRALRLQRARQLLAARGRTITEVAADCGFADSSHLCRTFNDLLDVTPKVYRRLCGEV
jgi:AraC family transcriptional regulator